MIDAIRRLDAIMAYDESLAHANTRRHELAQENGRLRGIIKMALVELDYAEVYPVSPEARWLVAEARRVLRLAIEVESEG